MLLAYQGGVGVASGFGRQRRQHPIWSCVKSVIAFEKHSVPNSLHRFVYKLQRMNTYRHYLFRRESENTKQILPCSFSKYKLQESLKQIPEARTTVATVARTLMTHYGSLYETACETNDAGERAKRELLLNG